MLRSFRIRSAPAKERDPFPRPLNREEIERAAQEIYVQVFRPAIKPKRRSACLLPSYRPVWPPALPPPPYHALRAP
jgi:hypothetical protein